jgi:hypothetical protein
MRKLVNSLYLKVKAALWRWFLRRVGDVVAAAEDWIHTEEVKLRQPVAAPAPVVRTDEFQIKASRVRERAHKAAARAARPRLHQVTARPARLRYVGGQFVREGVQ